MTLIEVRKADGTLVGWCDARCHDAVRPEFDCGCGGRNHGRGLAQAASQTREYAQALTPEHWKTFGEIHIPVLEISEPELQEKVAHARRQRRRVPIRLSDLRGAKYMRPLIQL